MRILVVVDLYPKLSETFVIDHVLGLTRRGHEVSVIARTFEHAALEHRRLQTARPASVAYRARGGRFARLRLTARGALAAFCRRPLRTLSLLASGARRADLVAVLGTIALVRGSAFDAVHAHFGPAGAHLERVRRLGFLGNVPFICSFHGYDASSFPAARPHAYDALFASDVEIVTNGRDLASCVVALGAEPSRVHELRVGIDLPWHARAAPRRAETPVRILSVGRLVEKKGHAYGIRALAEVVPHVPEVRYRIIGDGPLRADLERLTRELALSAHVEFAGECADADVASALEETDIFLLPSVTAGNGDRESMPVVAMEAMIREVPVVATRHAGIPDLVEDGVSGLLCPERDASGLATGLLALIADPERRARFGAAGRARVIARHDLERHLDDLLALYRARANRDPV